MKTAVCLVAILGYAFALPSSDWDWSKIKPEFAFIEPLDNVEIPDVLPRVIGGNEATPNSLPYQAAVFINGASFCGGSIISESWVLTAAHCTISASFVEVVLGAHNVRLNEATQLRLTSTSIVNHPNYISQTLTNDVSLIRLPQAVSYNANISPISLAPESSGAFTGSSALLSGWGRVSDASNAISPTLQQVSLNVVSNVICAGTYGTAVIRDSTICTSGVGTVGACNGDSGGPLVVNGVQVGVTSFVSARGCESGLPSGFARVSAFNSWIRQTAGLN